MRTTYLHEGVPLGSGYFAIAAISIGLDDTDHWDGSAEVDSVTIDRNTFGPGHFDAGHWDMEKLRSIVLNHFLRHVTSSEVDAWLRNRNWPAPESLHFLSQWARDHLNA